MLLGLHGLLLSHAVSEMGMHTYRVSHVKEKITKLFSWVLNEGFDQLKSATVMSILSKRRDYLWGNHQGKFLVRQYGETGVLRRR
jgi:hypothetical protein